jgi:hypothetical protein
VQEEAPMPNKKNETWEDQCPDCGRTNRMCMCDPRGGFFPDMPAKAEYYRTHPDKNGRVRSVPMSPEKIHEWLSERKKSSA